MTRTPSIAAATAIQEAVADGRAKPPIVTPTPTAEQLGDLATKMVRKRGGVTKTSGGNANANAGKKTKLLSPMRCSRTYGKVPFASVGYHDEMFEDDHNGSSSSGCDKTEDSALPLWLSSTSSSTQPPLISRYCGCCGDILSIKAYGFDENDRDRRLHFHPHDGTGSVCDPEKIREAAESVKLNLKNKPTKSSSKSTKASRKKKKLAARGGGIMDHHYHHESLKGLDPWPDESLRMDMTILEGLISLKNARGDEADCRCWKDSNVTPKESSKRELSMAALGGKSSSPSLNGKGKKLKVAKAAVGKAKTAVKKKATLTKGGKSITAGTPEVVSTKTVIVTCPKTGKKIKKTVRVVKKIVKKKRPLPKTPGGATTAVSKEPTTPSATDAPATATTTTPSPTGSSGSKPKTAAIPSFSSMGSGTTEKPDQRSGSGSKKRNHDEDEDDSASDDCSDDDIGGSSSLNKKRRRNDEKADLDLRERLMNCPLENGPLFPSQQELMELTTIRKRNALQTFYKRFNELRQFIAIFGDGRYLLMLLLLLSRIILLPSKLAIFPPGDSESLSQRLCVLLLHVYCSQRTATIPGKPLAGNLGQQDADGTEKVGHGE